MGSEVKRLKFSNGDIYQGWTSLDGQPHGDGKYVWKDGSCYEGSWKEGVKHGAGRYTWASGATYAGEWVDGYMQGVGTYESADGVQYQGSWLRDQKHGLGRKLYPNGDVYEGLWRDNQLHGPGRYIWADGNEYDGDWVAGKMHGQGTFVWRSGERYEGEWVNGVEEGIGLLTYRDGSTYDGFWNAGVKHGIGVLRQDAAPVPTPRAHPPEEVPASAAAVSVAAAADQALGPKQNGTHAAGLNSAGRNSSTPGSPDPRFGIEPVRRFFQRQPSMELQQSGASTEQRLSRLSSSEQHAAGQLASPFGHQQQEQLSSAAAGAALLRTSSPKALEGGGWPPRRGTPVVSDTGLLAAAAAAAGGELGQASEYIVKEYDHGRLLRQYVLSADDVGSIFAQFSKLSGQKPSSSSSQQQQQQQPDAAQTQHTSGHHHHDTKKRVDHMGIVVYKGHPSYDLMLQLQLGIRWSVSKVGGSVSPPQQQGVDFHEKFKVEFPRDGSSTTPVHPCTDFVWKDYAPQVFRNLRELQQVDSSAYLQQLCSVGALRLLKSPGKSGAVFFLSQDEIYLAKTICKAEFKLLKQLLPRYYGHIANNPNSLLVRFYGMHRISAPALGHNKVRFVVMGNIFRSDLQIHQKYDLKGSTLGRTAGPDASLDDPHVILKDLDLSVAFKLEEGWHQVLMRQLEADTRLLADCGVLDYSLLLGVHYRDLGNREAGGGVTGPSNFREYRSDTNMAAVLEELTRVVVERQLDSQAAADLLALARLNLLGAQLRQKQRRLTRSPTAVLAMRPKRSMTLRPLSLVEGGNEDLAAALGLKRLQLGISMAATALPLLQQRPAATMSQDVVLYFGIIDFLTPYNMRKRLEAFGKALVHGRHAPSATSPRHYAQRFTAFLHKVFT